MKRNFLKKFYYEYIGLFSTAAKTIIRNLKRKKFEPEAEILDRVINPLDSCFDIGGGYGRYALVISRIVGPKGRVFCFEPGRYSHRVLGIIKWFHRLNNVSIHKLALSDRNASINLCSPVKRTHKIGASLAYISESIQDNAINELVNMTTIDDFCMENAINQVNFIKCDTEGSEILIFRGAKDTIKKYQPVILCEVDAGNMSKYGCKPKDLEDFFAVFTYKIFSYRDGVLISNEKIIENGNYFFAPQFFVPQ